MAYSGASASDTHALVFGFYVLMYWYAKLILAVVVMAIVGSFVYAFRDAFREMPFFTGDEPEAVIEQARGAVSEPSPKSTPSISEVTKAELAEVRAQRQKLKLAADHLHRDDPLSARNLAENVLIDPAVEAYSETWMEAARIVSEANSIFLFSDAPCPEKVQYVVAAGDNLVNIAHRHKTTVAMLQKGNGLDETSTLIFPGQTFLIYKTNWNIKVIKSQFLLLLQSEERLIKCYKVGIGRQNRTPVGQFRIVLKEAAPTWYPPGRVVKYGDPENVLGTRWMQLEPIADTDRALKGYGIHGTWQPQSIGTAASQGCIRMVNSDVEELFDIVPEQVDVVIVE